MTTHSWQLTSPIDAVIFDCDGTLSQLEGIDELARASGMYEAVSAMTQDAMSKGGINISLYSERLNLVKPTAEQTANVGHAYCSHLNPDVKQVIKLLQQCNKTVYIVSAGLTPSINILARELNVAKEHVYAVGIHFDAEGHYVSFDHHSPLVTKAGKHAIVAEIKKRHDRLIYVGDGLNDFAAYKLATRFIGYGGAFYRENLAALCEYYIKSASMAPLVPLVLTESEHQQLTPLDKKVYEKGLQALQQDAVLMNSPNLASLEQLLLNLGVA